MKTNKLIKAKVVNNNQYRLATICVKIEKLIYLSKIGRTQKTATMLRVHHPNRSMIEVGKTVHIKQCRRMSKTKSYEVVYGSK